MLKLRDVKSGMKLKADGGFTCIDAGAVLTVQADEKGFPFVPCSEGGHWLGGQVSHDDTIIGFERV
jgi:hypothetical protein